MQKAAQKDSNIRLILNTILTEIKGSGKVEKSS